MADLVVLDGRSSQFVVRKKHLKGAAIKYVLLFCGTREQQQAWEEMSEEARQAQYAQVGRWFAEYAAKLGPGNQLQSPNTATTVRFQGDGSPSCETGRSSRATRSSAATPRLRSPISTRRCAWRRPGQPAAPSKSDQ